MMKKVGGNKDASTAQGSTIMTAFKITTLSALLIAPTLLSGCGFHLRGFETPLTYAVSKTVVSLPDNPTGFQLKKPLKHSLSAVGVTVVDSIGRKINTSTQEYTAAIKIENIRFKKYELVGVLTEIRLVLSADVTYQTLNNIDGNLGRPLTVRNPVQVEHSYQFNEATVSVEDQQGKQIKSWLYESLAKRIADQYVALNLPRIEPKALPKPTTGTPENPPSPSFPD